MANYITDLTDKYHEMFSLQLRARELCDHWAHAEHMAFADLMREVRVALLSAPEDAHRLTERIRAALAIAEGQSENASKAKRAYIDHCDDIMSYGSRQSR